MNTKTTFDAVLFDLDGTILDTADDLGAALNYMLDKYGLPLVPPEIFRPIASDGALGLLTLGFGETLASYDYETLRQEFLTYYENNISKYTTIYDGLTNTLQALENANIPWGIITNKPIGLTNILTPHYKALNHSAITIGGDSLPKRKPDPMPMFHCCSELNVRPERCLYVGDAPRDIEAGNKANMTTVIAGWGYIQDLKDCDNWSADYLAMSTADLHQFIFNADCTNSKQNS